MSRKYAQILTPRQEIFCNKYVELDFHGSNAAVAAGYALRSAYMTASRLLKIPKIKTRISEIINETLGTTKEQLKYRVIKRHMEIAFSDVTEDIEIITEKRKKHIPGEDGKLKEVEYDHQFVKIPDTKDFKNKGLISSIKQDKFGAIEVKFQDKDKSLELLGRYGALYTDKVEVESTGPEIHIYLPDNGRSEIDDN